jgi:hypothetical protein
MIILQDDALGDNLGEVGDDHHEWHLEFILCGLQVSVYAYVRYFGVGDKIDQCAYDFLGENTVYRCSELIDKNQRLIGYQSCNKMKAYQAYTLYSMKRFHSKTHWCHCIWIFLIKLTLFCQPVGFQRIMQAHIDLNELNMLLWYSVLSTLSFQSHSVPL